MDDRRVAGTSHEDGLGAGPVRFIGIAMPRRAGPFVAIPIVLQFLREGKQTLGIVEVAPLCGPLVLDRESDVRVERGPFPRAAAERKKPRVRSSLEYGGVWPIADAHQRRGIRRGNL